eukprot:SAG11_NODE_1039_length_6074_cov_11.968870_3_plen_224_part_00
MRFLSCWYLRLVYSRTLRLWPNGLLWLSSRKLGCGRVQALPMSANVIDRQCAVRSRDCRKGERPMRSIDHAWVGAATPVKALCRTWRGGDRVGVLPRADAAVEGADTMVLNPGGVGDVLGAVVVPGEVGVDPVGVEQRPECAHQLGSRAVLADRPDRVVPRYHDEVGRRAVQRLLEPSPLRHRQTGVRRPDRPVEVRTVETVLPAVPVEVVALGGGIVARVPR